MKSTTRILLIVSGTISASIGIIGMFLPVLPTTPFLLLAAFFYSRSSGRFYKWLLSNRLCGTYIRNYVEGKGIPARQKILTLIMLWLTIGYSTFYLISIMWIKILLLLIAAAVTFHVVKIKTLKYE
ncbi:MAG TPA: YbaN family protein [bacterium]|nr:YbaN family protein [bacterium]